MPSQSLENMALKGSTSGETSTDNTLSYSSVSGDATVCELQFNRLRYFLQDSDCLQGTNLLNLLFPIFVHMYLELLTNGHKSSAHKFINRHSSMFRTDSKQLELIDQLSKLGSHADITQARDIVDFKDLKYEVTVSQHAFEQINKHLKKEDNMITMQIFNQHIKLQVKGETSSQLLLGNDQPDSKKQPISPACIPDNKVVHDDQALTSLKKIIKEVRDSQPGLPSICFYTFLNAYQGLCCASISRDDEYLTGGFEDNSIRVWRLKPGLFPAVDNSDGPSVIFLSADYIKTDEEEDQELEKKRRTMKEKEKLTLRGHTGSVYQAKFTCDSNLLLSCSEDTTVRLWDMEKQTCAAIYRGHNYPVWDLDTGETGDYFATCSHDQTAKLWSTERLYPLRSFIGHNFDVDCVKFHPNSNYLATGSGDKTVRLWSLQDGKCVRLMPGHKSSILALAFSPNGQLLASAGEDRRVRVWDLRSGGLYKEFRGHSDTICSLSFNSSSSILASGGLDCSIRLWHIKRSIVSTPLMPDSNISTELLGAFPTKSSPVVYLNFIRHNVLQAAGAV